MDTRYWVCVLVISWTWVYTAGASEDTNTTQTWEDCDYVFVGNTRGRYHAEGIYVRMDPKDTRLTKCGARSTSVFEQMTSRNTHYIYQYISATTNAPWWKISTVPCENAAVACTTAGVDGLCGLVLQSEAPHPANSSGQWMQYSMGGTGLVTNTTVTCTGPPCKVFRLDAGSGLAAESGDYTLTTPSNCYQGYPYYVKAATAAGQQARYFHHAMLLNGFKGWLISSTSCDNDSAQTRLRIGELGVEPQWSLQQWQVHNQNQWNYHSGVTLTCIITGHSTTTTPRSPGASVTQSSSVTATKTTVRSNDTKGKTTTGSTAGSTANDARRTAVTLQAFTMCAMTVFYSLLG